MSSPLTRRTFPELVKIGTDHLSDISLIMSYGIQEILMQLLGGAAALQAAGGERIGVINGLVASVSEGTMDIVISRGMALRYDAAGINEAAFQHPCRLILLTADATVTLDNGDVSNPRLDLICITDAVESVTATMPIFDTATKEFNPEIAEVLSKNSPTVLVVKGTPAVNPQVPALPAGYLPLAIVQVDVGMTQDPTIIENIATSREARLPSLLSIVDKLNSDGDILTGILEFGASAALQNTLTKEAWDNFLNFVESVSGSITHRMRLYLDADGKPHVRLAEAVTNTPRGYWEADGFLSTLGKLICGTAFNNYASALAYNGTTGWWEVQGANDVQFLGMKAREFRADATQEQNGTYPGRGMLCAESMPYMIASVNGGDLSLYKSFNIRSENSVLRPVGSDTGVFEVYCAAIIPDGAQMIVNATARGTNRASVYSTNREKAVIHIYNQAGVLTNGDFDMVAWVFL